LIRTDLPRPAGIALASIMAVRQHRGVRPDQIAVDYWLAPIRPEDMPVLAARLLAEGHDSPALRHAAALAAGDDPATIRSVFEQALAELGIWIPDRAAAEQAAAASPARALLEGKLSTAECARKVRRIWDFDDVIYPVLPPSVEELVLMCWLHGGEEYDTNGGDKRLLAAARALARS